MKKNAMNKPTKSPVTTVGVKNKFILNLDNGVYPLTYVVDVYCRFKSLAPG